MRCAVHIRRKYQRYDVHMNPQLTNENQTTVVQVEDRLMQQVISSFKLKTQNGPTYVCTVCHRVLFPDQVRVCKCESYQKNPDIVSVCLTGKYVHVCTETCADLEQCTVPERREEWACHSCHENLKVGNMPVIAVMNKLELSPIPSELCDLNILERHIRAKHIPFAKIITLPKGQQRVIHGAVVCVPSEVETTVNSLPRPNSQSQLMKVKLKRCQSYKGHYQFQTLNMKKVLTAILKLKDIHSEYEDISVSDDAATCDPTIDSMAQEHFVNDTSDLMDTDSRDETSNTEEHGRNDLEFNSEKEGNNQTTGVVLDTCLQPADIVQEILSYGDGVFCFAPAEGNSPVSFFRVPKLEAMAFPVQFPTGENTLDELNRMKKKYHRADISTLDSFLLTIVLPGTQITFSLCDEPMTDRLGPMGRDNSYGEREGGGTSERGKFFFREDGSAAW